MKIRVRVCVFSIEVASSMIKFGDKEES